MAMVLTQEAYTLINATAISDGLIHLAYMSIGDANGSTDEPSSSQTSLVNELYRGPITRSTSKNEADATSLTLYLIIPANVGGFTVHEIGVYTADGVLFAVGNTTPIYKPSLLENANLNITFRCTLKVTQQVNIEINTDPNYALITSQVEEVAGAVISEHETNASTHRNLIGLLPTDGNTGDILIKYDGAAKWKPKSMNIPYMMSLDENLNSYLN